MRTRWVNIIWTYLQIRDAGAAPFGLSLVSSDSQSAQNGVLREVACQPCAGVSLSLRTMGFVVKETEIPKKNRRPNGLCSELFGILSLNHALGAFASLRVSAVGSPALHGVGGAAALTKKLPG